MKLIKYQLCTEINHGTEDEPQIEQVFSAVTLGWSEVNEEIAKARFVPDEAPNKDKWPKELHVKGNRLVDPDGKELAKARETPVALVCRNGQASAQAAQKLKKAGFAKVFWLDGGVAAWSEAQMPLARGRG